MSNKRQFPTLVGFLASKSSNPTTNDTVEFQGYDAVGDGGSATWKHNGETGQTPSQSPAQLGGNISLLNDGSGNQWQMVLSDNLEFDTFTELEASTVENIGQRLICRGRSNAEYIMRPASYTLQDGDATLASGLKAELQVDDGANIDWFGAVGDGVTIDTTFIQSAIDRGTYLVYGDRAKNYRCDSRVNLRSYLTLERITFDFTNMVVTDTPLRGIGTLISGVATIIADIQHGQRIIEVSDTSGFEKGDWIALKSDKIWSTVDNSTTGEAMQIQSILNATRIELSCTTDDAYLLSDNAEILLFPETYTDITIRDITMTGSGVQPVESNSSHGIYFASAKNIRVENCTIKSFGNSGINIDDCVNVKITNNELRDFLRNGVGYCVVTSGYSRNILISGNNMSTSRTAVTSGGLAGVCRDVIVSNNFCYGNFSACIGTKNTASGWQVTGNTCEGNIEQTGLGNGIRMAGRDFIVSNNILRGYFKTSISAFVYGDNSTTGNKLIITGNNIKDASFIAINVTLQKDTDVLSGVHIHNNTIEMIDTADPVLYDGVIYVRGRDGVIRNLIISNNTVINANQHCIDVRSVAPGVVKNVMITGNILEQTVAANADGSAFHVKTDGVLNLSNTNNMEVVND
ncbi:MAG: parallel beta-helix repeat protein [Enterobacterales bacterium]|jgi:parallel beta-helix repeat protein